jgi:hypothetical protein
VDFLQEMHDRCSNSAYTPSGGTIFIGNSAIEVRYSPTCGTNWARYTSSGYHTVLVYVERQEGVKAYDPAFNVYSNNRYSNQLYAPTRILARGCAYIDYAGPYCASWK